MGGFLVLEKVIGANTAPANIAERLHYRRDIDGLRAIAVLSVLFYHSGIAAVSGGFVGVDVFFVISGYLISRHIFESVAAKQFSIVDFYERRARRILPAYCFVSALALIGAWFILLPTEFTEFAKSLVSSTLFVSNIYFWQASDYFAPAAETLPLLHLWSLGVEEQFYLFFPPLVALFARFSRIGVLVVVGLIASLIASQAVVTQWPAAAFYLLPFRAWELLLGSLIAMQRFPVPPSKSVAGGVSAAGVALILFSVVTYTDKMQFPGASALVPCAGAAMIIWGGSLSNPLGRVLGVEPLAFVGRISYSLYLIHWPLIVFAKIAGVDLGPVWIFALSTGGATFSYFLIEQPIRKNRVFWSRSRVFGYFASASAVLLLAGASVMALSGMPGRLPPNVQYLAGYEFPYAEPYREGKCFLRPEQTAADFDATACLPPQATVILWGDSFAAHYRPGLDSSLSAHGITLGQMNASACPPIVGLAIPTRPNCRAFNDFALETILARKPDAVILSAYWLAADPGSLQLLDATIDRLKSAGINVVLLGEGPYYNQPVPGTLARRILNNDKSTVSGPDLLPAVYASDRQMNELFGAKVTYFSVIDAFCPNKSCPMTINGSEPIHWDRGHLTIAGSKLFGEKIVQFLVNQLQASSSRAVLQ